MGSFEVVHVPSAEQHAGFLIKAWHTEALSFFTATFAMNLWSFHSFVHFSEDFGVCFC